jgi:hypothetical protein
LEGYVGDDAVTVVNGLYAPGVPQNDWAFGSMTGTGDVNDDDVTIVNGLYGNGTLGGNTSTGGDPNTLGGANANAEL